jgi:hypothetical protein
MTEIYFIRRESIRATMITSDDKNPPADLCEECGAVVAEGRPGCLRLFEDILAREFSDYRYGRIHRLTVDAYSLQHPEEYMLSGKSFAAHLTGMCAALEYEETLAINQAVQKWLGTNPKIEKPAQIPEQRGNLTVAYIHGAADAEEHISRVREWAEDVWEAWAKHRELARRLINEAMAGTNKR